MPVVPNNMPQQQGPVPLNIDPQTAQQLQAMGITTGGQLISLLSLMTQRAPQLVAAHPPVPQSALQLGPGTQTQGPPLPPRQDLVLGQGTQTQGQPRPPAQPQGRTSLVLGQGQQINPHVVSPELLAAASRNLSTQPLDAGWDDGRY